MVKTYEQLQEENQELVELLEEIHENVALGETEHYSTSGDWYTDVAALIAKVKGRAS